MVARALYIQAGGAEAQLSSITADPQIVSARGGITDFFSGMHRLMILINLRSLLHLFHLSDIKNTPACIHLISISLQLYVNDYQDCENS